MPSEWKESTIKYKYTELPDEPRYIKKKKKKNIKKSNHKHHYESCVFVTDPNIKYNIGPNWIGTYCTICGRIGNINIGGYCDNPKLPHFENIDIFKDKFVTL